MEIVGQGLWLILHHVTCWTSDNRPHWKLAHAFRRLLSYLLRKSCKSGPWMAAGLLNSAKVSSLPVFPRLGFRVDARLFSTFCKLVHNFTNCPLDRHSPKDVWLVKGSEGWVSGHSYCLSRMCCEMYNLCNRACQPCWALWCPRTVSIIPP